MVGSYKMFASNWQTTLFYLHDYNYLDSNSMAILTVVSYAGGV